MQSDAADGMMNYEKIYLEEDARFRNDGIDDYLQWHQLTRIDFGLISQLVRGRTPNHIDWIESWFYRMIFPPGLLEGGYYIPVGNPSLGECQIAFSRLLERGLVRTAQAEDVANFEQRARGDVVVFPGVEAPEIGSFIPSAEAQRIWIVIFHGLLGYDGDPCDDFDEESGQTVEYSTHRPFWEHNDCTVCWPGKGVLPPHRRDLMTVEVLGPVMDYWWHVAPHGYRRTIQLIPEGESENKE